MFLLWKHKNETQQIYRRTNHWNFVPGGSRSARGAPRLHILLRRESLVVNQKRKLEEQLSLRLKKRKKRPSHLRVVIPGPSGPNEQWTEFTGKALDAWAQEHRVTLEFSRPGKTMDNGHIESFNGKLRDECLNQSAFLSLADARDTLEKCRQDYDQNRPHSALGWLTPKFFQNKFEHSPPEKNTTSQLVYQTGYDHYLDIQKIKRYQ